MFVNIYVRSENGYGKWYVLVEIGSGFGEPGGTPPPPPPLPTTHHKFREVSPAPGYSIHLHCQRKLKCARDKSVFTISSFLIQVEKILLYHRWVDG